MVSEERRWGSGAPSASSTSRLLIPGDTTNSSTVSSLQGERGHKGFKVREAPLLFVRQQTSIHHPLTALCRSAFPRETKVSGDATELTGARRVEEKQAAQLRYWWFLMLLF